MGLEISSIQNAELKRLAYAKDADNNNQLDDTEFNIFKQEAAARTDISAEDFNQAMGLFKNSKATVTNPVEKLSKKEVKQQELERNINETKQMFNKYVDAAKEQNLPLNYEQILKDVKKELKAQDKYDKKAFKEVEEYVENAAQKDANELVWLKIQEQTTETNARKIRNNVEQELKDSGLWNKYTKHALRYTSFTDKVSFGKSQGKEFAQDRARANMVAKHTYQTKEEILKEIDQEMFDKLVENNLIKANEDGKYDLSALQKVISDMIGADNVMNTGRNDSRSEKHNLRSELSERLGYASDKRISKGDRNDLVDLAGFKKQNGATKIIKNVLANTIGGAAIGAGTGAAANALFDPDPNVHVESNTNITIKLGQKLDGTTALPKGVTLAEDGLSLIVNASQIVDIPGNAYKLISLVGRDVALGAVAGGLVGLLSSLPSAIANLAEKEVEDNNFKECDFDKYVNFVKRNNPKYAPILEKLAGAFYDKENNVWHHDKYREFLNLASGDRSGLNRQEILGALRTTYEAKEKGKVIVNDCDEVILGPDKEPVKPTPTAPVKEKVQVEEKCNKFNGEIINGNKYLWQEITKGYECLSEYKPATAIRILKVIQAINDNNYDLTRLAHIAELTFKAGKGNAEALQELKTMPGFDYSTFLVWKGGTGMVKLPSNLGGNCELNKNAIVHNGKFGRGGSYTNNAKASADCEKCEYEYNGKRYAQTAEGRAQLQKDVGNKEIVIVKNK